MKNEKRITNLHLAFFIDAANRGEVLPVRNFPRNRFLTAGSVRTARRLNHFTFPT